MNKKTHTNCEREFAYHLIWFAVNAPAIPNYYFPLITFPFFTLENWCAFGVRPRVQFACDSLFFHQCFCCCCWMSFRLSFVTIFHSVYVHVTECTRPQKMIIIINWIRVWIIWVECEYEYIYVYIYVAFNSLYRFGISNFSPLKWCKSPMYTVNKPHYCFNLPCEWMNLRNAHLSLSSCFHLIHSKSNYSNIEFPFAQRQSLKEYERTVCENEKQKNKRKSHSN